MRLPLTIVATSLAALAAHAQGELAANPVLPTGVVACAIVKDVKDYHAYTTKAPAFAKDLLDRAACFVSETPQPAVVVGSQAGYTRYKLLSGHKVWVANNASSVN